MARIRRLQSADASQIQNNEQNRDDTQQRDVAPRPRRRVRLQTARCLHALLPPLLLLFSNAGDVSRLRCAVFKCASM